MKLGDGHVTLQPVNHRTVLLSPLSGGLTKDMQWPPDSYHQWRGGTHQWSKDTVFNFSNTMIIFTFLCILIKIYILTPKPMANWQASANQM